MLQRGPQGARDAQTSPPPPPNRGPGRQVQALKARQARATERKLWQLPRKQLPERARCWPWGDPPGFPGMSRRNQLRLRLSDRSPLLPGHGSGLLSLEHQGLCGPPIQVAPLVVRASCKARGVHFRPWIVTGSACQHAAYVLWYRQPPERRGLSPEVWTTLATDQELHTLFVGLVDGGAPGNMGMRIQWAKPAPSKTTSVRVPGYPAQPGLAVDE